MQTCKALLVAKTESNACAFDGSIRDQCCCMHAWMHTYMHMHMATWRISLNVDCRSIEPLCWLLSETIQETWLVAICTICSPRC